WKETSHAPTASTQDGGSPTPWHERTASGLLGPGSPSVGSVLPPIPRPPLCTSTPALLPAPEKCRRPRPSVQASLLPWPPPLLSACPPARLAPPGTPACAHHPPAPRRPPCGGGQAAPAGGHPLAPPGLLSHPRA